MCVLAVLCVIVEAPAFDKKTSLAMSHYIMAGMYNGLGDIDKAIQEYKKALRADRESLVIRLNLAADYIKRNQSDLAIEELKLATTFNPEAVEPHAVLALVYSAQNKRDLAAVEYENALKKTSRLNPGNIDIYKTLGTLYLQQKKLAEAEKTYRLILDLAPKDAEAHFYLANIYDEIKDRAKVEAELKKALELKPEYHEALNYLGYLYVEENKNIDQAELMIKKALELEPDNGAYVDSLGWLYFKQGRFDEALKELKRAALLQEDPVIYDHLGDVYSKTGDSQNARIQWEKSLGLDKTQDKVKEKLKQPQGK